MNKPKVNCAFDEMRDVVTLTAHPRNPNTHSDDQIRLLSKIIQHQGWRLPIVVSNLSGFIVAGHGRLQAAQKLGLEQVPVDLQDFENEADELAHLVADNRIAELAEIDRATLADIIGDLDTGDFDLEFTGFELPDVEELMTAAHPGEGLTDDDDVPDAPEDPTTKKGDIWLLGDHRLMCGDSTSLEAVEKLMDGKKANMVFTSPPYNADAKAGQGDIFNKKKSVRLYSDGYKDKLPSNDYVDFASLVLDICFSVTDGLIFWNVSYNANSRFEYIQQIQKKLPCLIEQICWKKSSTIPFKGSLMREWEPIYIFSTDKKPLAVKEVSSNFWQVSNTNSQGENHKACFPVELPERGISITRKKTGIIFEPFGGSGTTMIAAEKRGWKSRLMELDEKYCDVTINRWQNFTGKQATHAETGKTFDQS